MESLYSSTSISRCFASFFRILREIGTLFEVEVDGIVSFFLALDDDVLVNEIIACQPGRRKEILGSCMFITRPLFLNIFTEAAKPSPRRKLTFEVDSISLNVLALLRMLCHLFSESGVFQSMGCLNLSQQCEE
jgi:hypothetical protein